MNDTEIIILPPDNVDCIMDEEDIDEEDITASGDLHLREIPGRLQVQTNVREEEGGMEEDEESEYVKKSKDKKK